MGRTHRTPHAVLGALATARLSGLFISKVFDSPRFVFWSETVGRVYPALKKLKANAHVELLEFVPGQDGGKKIYAITDAGIAALTAWLESAIEPMTMRDEVALRVSFGAHVEHDATRELLAAEIERVSQALVELDELDTAHDSVFERMGQDWSVSYLSARLEWCLDCLEHLEHLDTRTHREHSNAPPRIHESPLHFAP